MSLPALTADVGGEVDDPATTRTSVVSLADGRGLACILAAGGDHVASAMGAEAAVASGRTVTADDRCAGGVALRRAY
jgi:hypothetical protein